MHPTEGADGERVPEHGAERAIAPVLHLPQAVAVVDPRPPPRDLAPPRARDVVHAHVPPQGIPSPAIVVARHPHHRPARVRQLGDRRQYAEPGARNHVAPLEPEVEEVAGDHQRAGRTAQRLEETQEHHLRIAIRDPEVRVRYHVARGREHAPSISACSLFTKPRGARIFAPDATPKRGTDGSERARPHRDKGSGGCHRGGRCDGQGGQCPPDRQGKGRRWVRHRDGARRRRAP